MINSNKKTKLLSLLFALGLLVSSCSLILPVNATGYAVGSKVGTAKATGYVGFFFFNGDASIKTAAKNGGITRISSVDIKRTSIAGIVVTYETIVSGE